jgi:broad specificity phosphatase PhoE
MILMRHGQSHFNARFGMTHVDPGLRDPGLTDLGRAQATAAAAHLRRGMT